MDAMSLTNDTGESIWPSEENPAAGMAMCPQEDNCDCCYYPYIHPAETPVPGSQATLGHCPFEVISRIAFYLPDDSEHDIAAGVRHTGDINALARTNRFYYDCLNEDLYKANIKYGGSSALYWAIANNRKDTLDLMIRYGADINRTDNESSSKYGLRWFEGCGNALHVAIAHNRADIANFLLDNGSDAGALTVPNDWGHACSALEIAIRAELPGFAMRLIAMDSDINRENENFHTPLQQVLIKHEFNNPADRLLILERLLQMGANVNCASVNAFSFPGHPPELDAPLNLAFRWGEWSFNSVSDETKQVVQMLLVHGADVQERVGPDEQSEVMHQASLRGWDDIVEELLMRGANVNALDNQGLTPLAYAVNMCMYGSAEVGKVELCYLRHDEYHWTGNVATVKLLLKHGADPDAMSLKGWTPRKIAALNTNELFVTEFKDELLVGDGLLETPEVLCKRPTYGQFDWAVRLG